MPPGQLARPVIPDAAAPTPFSGIARLAAVALTVPAFVFLDSPADIAVSVVIAGLLWLVNLPRAGNPFRHMRSFLWFAPGLILANGLTGPPPRLWGLLSGDGLVLGLVVVYRFAWAAWVALVLVRSCPAPDLLAAFRAVLRFLHIPDRNVSRVLFLTIEMVPRFADIGIRDFRRLPDAIARRIESADAPEPPPRSGTPAGPRAADLALVLPAAAATLAAVLL